MINIHGHIHSVDISVSITPSGTSTVGQYSLTCSVAVTGSTDTPTGLVTTGSMSSLIFNPLAATHAGIYTCEVRLGGAVKSEKIMVIVKEGEISISICNYCLKHT